MQKATKLVRSPTVDVATKDELIAELASRVSHFLLVMKRDGDIPMDESDPAALTIRFTDELPTVMKLIQGAALSVQLQMLTNGHGDTDIATVQGEQKDDDDEETTNS